MSFYQDLRYGVSFGKAVLRYFYNGQPLVKSYDITYRCNLSCIHCYFYKNHSKVENDPISDGEWENIFYREKNAGVYELYLTGGEPMLRPKVIEAATKIFGAQHVNIVTNGTIKIPASWKNNIFVSIDGNEELQKEIRGSDILNTIISNIKDNKRVIISATVTKMNYKKLNEVYRVAKTANVKGVSFSFYTGKTPKDSLDGEIMYEAIESLMKIKNSDPEYVLLTDKMLNILKEKSHVKKCVLRKGMVVSHLPNMDVKKPCIFGEGIDCNNCGCHVPIFAEAFKKIDFETIRMARRAFS